MKSLTDRLHALRWHLLSRMPSRRRRHPRGGGDAPWDMVFVTPPSSSPSWILGAFCRELASRWPSRDVRLVHADEALPEARAYFFSHYMYFVRSQRWLRPGPAGRRYVFATHLEPSKHGVGGRVLGRLLDRADGVVCMNRALQRELERLGVAPERLTTLVGAADASAFRPHPRQPDGCVGINAAYYPRKAPDRVLELVEAMPHRRFLLLGRGWQAYPAFARLAARPNFEYVEAPFDDYPMHYRRMSVFVSMSMLEGGPIPLLEAMMSNVVPVASRTGFAPDLIQHGVDGFLFDVDEPIAHVARLVDAAFEVDGRVDGSVQSCDWAAFTRRVAGFVGADASDRPRIPAQ